MQDEKRRARRRARNSQAPDPFFRAAEADSSFRRSSPSEAPSSRRGAAAAQAEAPARRSSPGRASRGEGVHDADTIKLSVKPGLPPEGDTVKLLVKPGLPPEIAPLDRSRGENRERALNGGGAKAEDAAGARTSQPAAERTSSETPAAVTTRSAQAEDALGEAKTTGTSSRPSAEATSGSGSKKVAFIAVAVALLGGGIFWAQSRGGKDDGASMNARETAPVEQVAPPPVPAAALETSPVASAAPTAPTTPTEASAKAEGGDEKSADASETSDPKDKKKKKKKPATTKTAAKPATTATTTTTTTPPTPTTPPLKFTFE